MMVAGDERVPTIYETIGSWLGYALAHYADFYEIDHVLVLGRVTIGEGGEIIVRCARDVLAGGFPDLSMELHLPDEHMKTRGTIRCGGEPAATRQGDRLMEFRNPGAQIYVPDGITPEAALARTTHMAVGAHQDDIPIMAFDGPLRCFGRKDQWFLAVTVTDGAGSPRADLYADLLGRGDEGGTGRRREEGSLHRRVQRRHPARLPELCRKRRIGARHRRGAGRYHRRSQASDRLHP